MYRISKIESWCGVQVELSDPGLWYSLISDFGEPLLHLLIDERFAKRIPDDPLLSSFKNDIVKSSIRAFPLRPGSAWVLFAYGTRLDGLPEPFSRHGFMLPLEWRREAESGESRHSPLLPDALVALADRVKAQMAQAGCPADDCYLYPASEFGGTVDFHIENSGFESAWGALAVGLWSLLKGGRCFVRWPFSSIAYDFDLHALAPVAELTAKFHVASALGAEEFAVAPQQISEARRVLREMRRTAGPESPLREMRIFSLPQTDSIPAVLNALMRCNQVSSFRRHLKGWIANAAVIALVGLLAGVWHWDSHREVVRNFAECETRWGIPVGKGELDKEKSDCSHGHYEFHFRGRTGLVGNRQVATICLFGTNHQEVGRAEFKCNSDGTVSERRVFAADGAWVRSEKFSDHSAKGVSVDYEYPIRKRPFTWQSLRACVRASFPPVVRHVKYRFDDQGWVADERCFTYSGDILEPCASPRAREGRGPCELMGLDGVLREWNSATGKPTAPMPKDAPVADYVFNDYGLPTDIRYFCEAGEPVLGSSGWHHAVLRYSAHGDFLGCRLFGVSDEPVVGFLGTGCAGERFHELRLERDALGNLRVLEYKDAQGALLPQENGVAKWEYSYHVSTGQMSESRSFDAAGHPCPAGDHGPVRTEYQSETNGLSVKCEYNLNGRYRKLMLAGGMDGRVVREEFHKADGRSDINEHGVSTVTFVYDAQGRETRRLFFDAKGHPVKVWISGIAGLETVYDENGRVSLRTHLGVDGKPHRDMEGIVSARYMYDSLGRETERIFFDTDNTPSANVEGVAFVETRYDDRTNVVLFTTYFRGQRRQLVNVSHGYAVRRSRKVYADGLLLLEEWALFDADEKPVADRSSGNFRVVSLFNASGQVTNQSCYAADETLRLHHEARYDLARRLVYQREESQGTVGEKILLHREPDGSSVYRHSGVLVARDENAGAVVAAFDVTYDVNGDQICLTFLDRDGNKVTNVLGVAESKRVYDERRELIEQNHWNATGEMVAPRGTVVARVTHQYQYGREDVRQTSRFFDKEDFLVGDPGYGGAAVLEAHWNADNLLTKLQFWNPLRRPVANRHYLTGNVAVTELRIAWDENGRLREFVGFDDTKEAAPSAKRHPVIHVAARFDSQKNEYLLFRVNDKKTSERPFVRIPASELERNLTRRVRWH